MELKSKNDFIHQELLTSLFTFSANSEYSFDSFAFNSVGIATLNNELYPKNEDDTARCLYLLKEKESKIYLDVINCFTNIFNFVQMANFNSLKIPQFGGKIINSIYEEDTIYIDVFKLEGLEEPLSFFDLSFSMKKTLYTLTQIACGSLYKNKIIMIENIDCGISYPLIEKLFSSIVLLNKNSKQEEAEEMLEDLLAKKPEYYKASELLGTILYDQEKFKQAVSVYLEALKSIIY